MRKQSNFVIFRNSRGDSADLYARYNSRHAEWLPVVRIGTALHESLCFCDDEEDSPYYFTEGQDLYIYLSFQWLFFDVGCTLCVHFKGDKVRSKMNYRLVEVEDEPTK